MKLIIDIQDFVYNNVKDFDTTHNYELNIVESIKNGIPLPKGHGRLIDADELRLDIIAHKYSNNFCTEHNIDQSINVGMLNILITDAPTIIEADKGE